MTHSHALALICVVGSGTGGVGVVVSFVSGLRRRRESVSWAGAIAVETPFEGLLEVDEWL